jgi:hypothetical protein
MVLTASGLARGHDRENGCSVKTLRGTYVFSASGFNIVSGVPQPKAILEVIEFNGDGTLSVPAATVAVNGLINRTLPGGLGTYTVAEDCSGTITIQRSDFRYRGLAKRRNDCDDPDQSKHGVPGDGDARLVGAKSTLTSSTDEPRRHDCSS